MANLKQLFAISIIIIILIAAISSFFILEENEDTPLDQTDLYYIQDSYNETSIILEMLLKVNESTIEKHVKTIQDFGPHPPGSTTLDKVKEYIYHELTNSGLTVRYDQWRYKLRRGENIYAL